MPPKGKAEVRFVMGISLRVPWLRAGWKNRSFAPGAGLLLKHPCGPSLEAASGYDPQRMKRRGDSDDPALTQPSHLFLAKPKPGQDVFGVLA